ncbi:MAG: hypothetical protein ACTFAK_09785 [Candidatus Electronema sp. VV]
MDFSRFIGHNLVFFKRLQNKKKSAPPMKEEPTKKRRDEEQFDICKGCASSQEQAASTN